jgi:Tfp pilus assembly protein PilV
MAKAREGTKRPSDLGVGTIEVLVVFSLFGVALAAIVGLHMVAISAGAAAETSSVATNVARARLEELRSLPPAEILKQDGTEVVERVPADRGPAYTTHTTVDASDPARLDITVRVTWDVPFGAACAVRGERECAGSVRTLARTLETRIRRP